MDNVKIVLASMYLDINQHFDDNLLKIDTIIQHSRREGNSLAMDSNSKSTILQDKRKKQDAVFLKIF